MSSHKQESESFSLKAKKGSLYKMEQAQKGLFILCTYTILLCAGVVFGTIVKKGAPILWAKGWDFIVSKPQSLSVMEVSAAKGLELSQKDYDLLHSENAHREDYLSLPFANEERFQKESSSIEFELQPESVLSEGYLGLLEARNKGFRPDFIARDKTALVGFELAQDSTLQVDTETLGALRQSDLGSQELDVLTQNKEGKSFEVVFAQGRYSIDKRTYTALEPSELIFILEGRFADDDVATKQVECSIPHAQTLILSPAQVAASVDREGGFAVSEKKELVKTMETQAVTLKKGVYELPFHTLKALVGANPVASFLHQHTFERAPVRLNLKQAVSLTLSQTELAELQQNNPAAKIGAVKETKSYTPYVRFDIERDCELLAANQQQVALKDDNTKNEAFKIFSEYTHSYSGGGILGPIVGTGFLVIICMVVALSIGVAAAVYLNEYARKGTYLKVVRLAMMNLAGVPSIVFGLFGLGLFVFVAPKFTSKPSLDDKFQIPLLPVAGEPSLRKQESHLIYMIGENADKTESLSIASNTGFKTYYDGWYYLSFEGWGACMLAGGFTLAVMVLPVIITSCEESLRAVPMGFREASLALGASKWQSVRTAVLPYALPGILTASVLGITRVAGETAPIMFTSAVAERSLLPWEGLANTGFEGFIEFLSQSVQALPYHIYTVAGRIPQSEYTQPMQYGSVLVFLILVLSLAALSVYLRVKVRSKLKW